MIKVFIVKMILISGKKKVIMIVIIVIVIFVNNLLGIWNFKFEKCCFNLVLIFDLICFSILLYIFEFNVLVVFFNVLLINCFLS